MTTAVIGAGLWLALLPAQVPPSAPKKEPALPAAVATPATDSLGDPLPDSALLRLGTLRFYHPSSASDLALSPDGKTVATAGRDVIAWDAATGKELWRATPRDDGFDIGGTSAYGRRPLAFTPDGRLIMPGKPGELAVRNARTGKATTITLQRTGPAAKVPVYSIDISPDGKALAVGTFNRVTVCDFDGKVHFEVANTPAGPVAAGDDRLLFGGHYAYGVFAPKGKVLAIVTSDSPEVIRLLDSESGEQKHRIETAARPVRLAFSPDAQVLVATERDQAVRAYSVVTGKRLWETKIKLTNPYENYTSAVAVRPDGKTVVVGATDKHIYLLNARNGEETGRLTGHGWYPWGLAFTADGSTLYSVGWDGPVRRWDVAKRQQLPLPKGVRGSAMVAASPDGKTIAYEDDADNVRLVDPATGAERGTLRIDGASYSQLKFSPDGRRLAGGGTSGEKVQVAVWDLSTAKVLHRFEWPKGRDPHSTVECLAFTPDGSRLAAAVFRQSSARVWDLGTGKELAHLTHDHVYGLSFSPDGGTLATAGWDKRLRLWDVDRAKVIREKEIVDGKAADNRMYTVCFEPHGGLIATAHLDGRVRIWDAGDLTLKVSFEETSRFTFGSIAFSPDGLWLATGTQGGEVHLWDPRSGQKVWDRGKHGGYAYTVGFGRDSRTLLSGGNDGVGYLWDLRPKEKSAKELSALWDDLRGTDGPAAHRAMWALAGVPEPAVKLLREKLRPEPPADLVRVRKLIAELDDAKFAVRSAAHAELSKLGARAAIPLREALGKATSTEQRDRLTKLLDEIAAAARPAELRNRRAVTVLSWIATPEAKTALEEWAKADAGGSLGGPAAAALKLWR